MLRVAYVVHTFDTGGIERSVAHLANHLDRARFRPVVISMSRNGAASKWIVNDVPIIELRKRPANDLAVIFRLTRTLREHSVDVVHSHNWGTLVETALARRWAKVACHVHTEHGQGLHINLRGMKRLLRRWATRWAFNQADAVLVCAESVRPLVHARSGFPESRLQFIPNGVEDPAAAGPSGEPPEIRQRLRVSDDALMLGSLGRLVPVKDFGTAIEALRILVERGHNLHLVLVGDGPEQDNLAVHARRAGIPDRVHLLGRQENVGDWLRGFDVYVNSSLSEAMSMGILEAMAAGLPIVATDAGDNASLVNGGSPCGIVVPPADALRLAGAIAFLVSDGSKRAHLSDNARRRFVSEYNVNRMTARYSEMYVRLISQRSISGRRSLS